MKGINLNMRLLAAILIMLVAIVIIIIITVKILKPKSVMEAGYELCLLMLSRVKIFITSQNFVEQTCGLFREA